MLHRLILAAALAAGLSAAAQAQTADVVQVCGATSGVVSPIGPGGHLTRDVNGQLCIVSAGTQTVSGTVTANQGNAGTVPWPVSWTGQSVGLTQGGAALSATNPIFASITNLPSVQAISAAQLPASLGQKTVANSLSVALASDQASTLAQDTSVQAVKTTLGSPFQAGGSIGNTAFGITGQLPGYASTPTFNIGTTNGLALDATVTARLGTLGQKTSSGSAPVVIASDQSTVPISGTVAATQSGQWSSVGSGAYINTLQNLASGGINPYWLDRRAQVKTSETGSDDPLVAITPAVTQAGTSVVGKASQGNLYSAYAVNGTATAGFLVCINATTAPTAGAAITPVDVAMLAGAAGATAFINYASGPPNGYATGVTCLVTTSLTTYTAGGNAFMQARVR